jgi:putative transposase
VRCNLHRAWKGSPKAITVERQGRRWWVSVRCVDVPRELLSETGRQVGIDLGVCSLVATSDGDLVTEGRHGRKAATHLARAQADLARKERGSGRRRRAVEAVASAHRKVASQRRDLAHKVSRQLVNSYDLIAVEDLKISSMVKKPKAKKDPDSDGYLQNGAKPKAGLNRSIHDAGWGVIVSMLDYKAEEAGRRLVLVDPRHSSQRCAQCGHSEADNRRTQASFLCRSCGHGDHADVNAAKNILWAGRARQASACGGSGS